MAAAGIAITVGSITAANELFFAPVTGSASIKDFNWRIIPATAIFAGMLALLEKVNPTLASGIGYTALVTVLFTRVGNAASPAQNLDNLLGYGGKK
jgi:hypothetical protein